MKRWSTRSKITKDENAENVSFLEIIELILVRCNIVNNNYQQDSRVFHAFVLKPLGQLLDISRKKSVF